MACMCGDLYCISCGPAQGNHRCEECGRWSMDGGCIDESVCEAKNKAYWDAIEQQAVEDEESLQAFYDSAEYRQESERLAQNAAKREYEESSGTCSVCGKIAYFGQCDDNACRASQEYQHWLEQIEDDKWIEREDESGIAFCPHDWNVSIVIDGGDVAADRICKHCQRHESQILCVEPEAPNCFIPGVGWRVI